MRNEPVNKCLHHRFVPKSQFGTSKMLLKAATTGGSTYAGAPTFTDLLLLFILFV